MAGVGDYRITMHNRPQDDTTPLTSESPTSTAAESPALTVKSGAMLTYGAYAARTTYKTIVDRTRANGNESKANTLSNMGTVGAKAVMAYATGGLSLIPEAIMGVAEVYTNYQERERENTITEIENSLRGQRINFKSGGGEFD